MLMKFGSLWQVSGFLSWTKVVFGKFRLSNAIKAGLLSTSVWQIANYLIPLLTFPYLARVLGVSGYGIIGIASAVIAYALLITEWGFGYTATQAVAREREDADAINGILWATVSAKALLGLLSSGTIVIAAIFFVHDPQLKAALAISTLNVVGSVFNVDWVLRGLSHLSKFATASIIGRLAAVPLVFLLVHRSDEVAEAIAAGAAGSLFTAVITWEMLRRMGILQKPRISQREIFLHLKEGFHVFLSTVIASLYSNTLTVALGGMTGVSQVGLFAGADKIRRPIQSLLDPVSMVAYPRMGYLAKNNPKKAQEKSLIILWIYAAIGLVLSVGLFLTAPIGVWLLLGSGFDAAIPVLRIMAWLIFIIGINTALGQMVVLPFGLNKELSICALLGAVIGFVSVFPLSYYAGAFGAAIAAVLAETTVAVSFYIILTRRFDWFRPFGRLGNWASDS